MDRKKEDVFETKDLSLAAFLYASGEVELITTKKTINREIYFLYTPREIAEKLVQKYWNLQAPSIQPKLLFGALRDIKDMIFGS